MAQNITKFNWTQGEITAIKQALRKYTLYKIKWQDPHTSPYIYYAYIFWPKLFVFWTGNVMFMYVYLTYGAVWKSFQLNYTTKYTNNSFSD